MAEREKSRRRSEMEAAVKRRLSDACQAMQLPSVYSLKTQLEERGVDVCYNTLARTLDTRSTTCDFYLAYELCDLWGLDIRTVFAPPSDQSPVACHTTLIRNKVLADKRYMNTYYGYMLSRNEAHLRHGDMELRRFRLTFSEEDGRSVAVLATDSSTYTGIPYLSDDESTVFIHLKGTNGNFYEMYFDYRKYNRERMYFRYGVMVTKTSGDLLKMLVQNFLLTLYPHEKIEEKVGTEAILGALSIDDGDFTIEKDIADRLRATDPEIDAFFRDNLAERHVIDEKTVYFIKDAPIVSLADTPNKISVLRTLLKIKAESLSPRQLEYSDVRYKDVFKPDGKI